MGYSVIRPNKKLYALVRYSCTELRSTSKKVWGSEGTNPCTLSLVTRGSYVNRFRPPSLETGKGAPNISRTGGWVGYKAGLQDVAKKIS